MNRYNSFSYKYYIKILYITIIITRSIYKNIDILFSTTSVYSIPFLDKIPEYLIMLFYVYAIKDLEGLIRYCFLINFQQYHRKLYV